MLGDPCMLVSVCKKAGVFHANAGPAPVQERFLQPYTVTEAEATAIEPKLQEYRERVAAIQKTGRVGHQFCQSA